MLRLTALLLLLANLGYFAWSQGHLSALGWAPADVREPQRLQQQVSPEKLQVLPVPAEASATAPAAAGTALPAAPAAATAASPATPPSPADEPAARPAADSGLACYQAGGFTPGQAQALRVVLATLPWAQNRWTLDEAVLPERWIVYMGRYADTEALNRKKAELRQLRVDFRDAPTLMPGLALGTYSTEAAAQQALAELVPRGVRTARVVKEREEQKSLSLRLNGITPAQRAEVEGLQTAMAGRRLAPC